MQIEAAKLYKFSLGNSIEILILQLWSEISGVLSKLHSQEVTIRG